MLSLSRCSFVYRCSYIYIDDKETYEVIDNKEQAITGVIETIEDWTEKYANEPGMTPKIKTWIIPTTDNKAGNMYVNPKAHKPDKNYPGRLISTGCASHTKNLSILTAHELKKVTLQYNLKDTGDLLRKIDKLNEERVLEKYDEILHVSFDIVAMFPNIPEEMGREECRKHLDAREEPVLFSTDCILEGIDITLKNNLTEFNGNMLRQIKGTAMGPSNACDYADVSVNKIDQLIYDSSNGWVAESGVELPFYVRYRDDMYIPWVHGLELLQSFATWLNSIHESLQFTMSSPSLEGTEFLDTFIYNKGYKLNTKVYSKPCDTHSFLVPTSCHATHIVENIPKGVAHRLFRICSEQENYEIAKSEFTEFLKARGYNENLVCDAFGEIEKQDRRCLLNLVPNGVEISSNTPRGRCYPLVTDFNPALPNLARIINKFKHILDIDPKVSRVIPPESVFVSFRRAKNFKDLVVHSKLRGSIDNNVCKFVNNICSNTESVNLCKKPTLGSCKPCGNKKCVLHEKYLSVGSTFTSFHTDQVFNIVGDIDCNTKGIIYLIDCKACRVSYVGYTQDNAKVRFSNHKSHIKKCIILCEFTKHMLSDDDLHPLDRSSFKSYDESLSKLVDITLIERVEYDAKASKEEVKRICHERETHWHHELRTLSAFGGLNKREDRRR